MAIAGNAVENVVGVQLSRQKPVKYAFTRVILNSPIQIALMLAPRCWVLVGQIFGLASADPGGFGPMLIVALLVAVVLAAIIAFDGESAWLEGATLIVARIIAAIVQVGLTNQTANANAQPIGIIATCPMIPTGIPISGVHVRRSATAAPTNAVAVPATRHIHGIHTSTF